ncbi:carboxypeptidase-like regulatory domain-containing protein [Ulvibacterium marinum]|uniref:carboxypeptidase-like regulatory domain-containing protein n=1 Tax=Ulvibacterium marinum TaxID=2419782 RepID=UPI00249430C1|nr:carboxypeptidase-like regulatory domain-containing protein [Ulvibacterium marinum]
MIQKIVLIIPFLFSAILLAQETSSISGRVLDNELSGEPMLFADVMLKNTEWKTQTNFHGNFEIDDVDPGNYILVISFLGYDTLEIPIEAKPNGVLQIQRGLSSKTIDPGTVIVSNSESMPYGSIASMEKTAQK